MQIGITISNNNYHNAFKLREERKLSGLIDSFLTNYFDENKKHSDLFNEKIKLKQEKEKLLERINKVSIELTIIDEKINRDEEQKTLEGKQKLEIIREKSRAIKNSGLFDDIGV